jgi:cytochrome c oxidase assembly protein subunit 15
MEWAPLSGALPPLSDAEWQRLFNLYKEVPQYGLMHEGFGLDGFKQIFWLEWAHRLWGRLIGCAFLLPLIALYASARVERRLLPRLGLLFALGGLQGAAGWFMVKSGFFPDSTSVSPYRLVVHLVLALTLYAAIVWTGLSVINPVRRGQPVPVTVRLTIVAGGFVAGLHAGFTYNTFPLMDGRLIPEGYAALEPPVRNLTENIAAVQFDHRLLATMTLIAVTLLAAVGPIGGLSKPLSALLGAAVGCQYLLGVATLLFVVPVPLAALHQLGAVLLLTALLVVVHRLSRWPTSLSRAAIDATPRS